MVSRTWKVLAILALFALVFAGATAFAQHAAKGNAPEDAAAGAAAQQVAVDKNGKFRAPTQEEIQQLISGMKLNDSAEGLTAKTVGNGTVVLDLQGRFETIAIAKINPDGTISKACVVNPKGAEEFLKSDPIKAKQQQKANSDPSTWEVK